MTILEELSILKYLQNFIKMGVTETRLLLGLAKMDFHIMSYDWEMPDDDIARLKQKVALLIEQATVNEEPTAKPEYDARKKQVYGRVYLHNGVQGFEYVQASFGGPPPIGPLEITLSDPIQGCPRRVKLNLTTAEAEAEVSSAVDPALLNDFEDYSATTDGDRAPADTDAEQGGRGIASFESEAPGDHARVATRSHRRSTRLCDCFDCYELTRRQYRIPLAFLR
jgi:hypothetical protein